MRRRNFLAGLAAFATAGCDRIGQTGAFKGLVDTAERMHHGAHRMLGGGRLAREYSVADISPTFRGNGTTDIAVFRSRQWFVQGQPPFTQIWGTNCDIPQPFPYAIRALLPHGGCADG